MPIYEFECNTCGHRFDKLLKMTAPDPACPRCLNDTRRLISACNHELKGTGWYKTDFRDKT